jgi:methylmalonyl-CoA mutase C-terminal domain/subunit
MSSTGAGRPIRVVVAESGPEGHDDFVRILARALRDAGHEIVWAGPRQTAEQVVATAVQEDADLIGLSVPSGTHLPLFRSLIDLLARRDASDIVVLGGGTVPPEDIPVLEELGVAKVFGPGAAAHEIADWVAGRFGEQATA